MMSSKEVEEFYRNLSRKELQSLCKRCGLPANRSHSEMVESLLSYVRGSFGVSFCKSEDTSGSRFISRQGGSGTRHKKPTIALDNKKENLCKFACRTITVPSSSKENSSYMTKIPAFQFFVSSEEGINLCVDLDANPAEWINKYKNQVYTCDNMINPKSRSLPEELGCIGESNNPTKASFSWSMDPEKSKNVQVEAERPGLVVEGNSPVRTGQTNGNTKVSMPTPILSCRVAVGVSECLDKEQGIISLKPSPNLPSPAFSNTYSVSCKKDGCDAAPDSDLINAPVEKIACDFANSVTADSIHLLAFGHRPSKPEGEVYERSILQNGYDFEVPSLAFPGCLGNLSIEKKLSETGNYHKDASYSLDKSCKILNLVDAKDNACIEPEAFTNISRNDASRNHLPTFLEEQEWSNLVSGRESSVCSEVDYSGGKTSLLFDSLESNVEFHKKRLHVDIEGENGSSECDAKISRRMEQSAGVLPRRSMRLVSKEMYLKR
ncbi:hypothetical protein K2173_019127 [Erythroxylum novogranatense]|uniref:SAP domain-containing protein n=1 Tax=Erythroxylum novogranatense TaxID=1862640 RepID=A0AAV8STI9_9ROSI|nr:hypothetical protein K2173_019127 [Erythroxylum novogranatense]